MYETALPQETAQRVADLNPAGVVVGIPSYRNSKTVGAIVAAVGEGLHRSFAYLNPVIVNVDGHSFDTTLSVARRTRTPRTVRRIATRYVGLPGRGSALRAIFEIAVRLQAQVVLIVEADVVSFRPYWVERLLRPMVLRQADLLLPVYADQNPIPFIDDLLISPVIAALFGVELARCTPGEVAMAGDLAAYFAERDVWETDVARNGVDIWMTVEALVGGARVVQVALEPKWHQSPEAGTLQEAKFLQEVGTLFRLAYLQRRIWQQPVSLRPVPLLPSEFLPRLPTDISKRDCPCPTALWELARAAARPRLRTQWEQALLPAHFAAVERILAAPEPRPGIFSARLWARVIYDCITAYNKGEGDPDKVVLGLYPLFLARQATVIAEAMTPRGYGAVIQEQARALADNLSYFARRWECYISPEQAALRRELGLL